MKKNETLEVLILPLINSNIPANYLENWNWSLLGTIDLVNHSHIFNLQSPLFLCYFGLINHGYCPHLDSAALDLTPDVVCQFLGKNFLNVCLPLIGCLHWLLYAWLILLTQCNVRMSVLIQWIMSCCFSGKHTDLFGLLPGLLLLFDSLILWSCSSLPVCVWARQSRQVGLPCRFIFRK